VSNASTTILVVGGTGKTGSRVAAKLTKLGLTVRTAARNGVDVSFDWDDPTTHGAALADVDRVYLVAPVLRTDFADQVSSFLDLAEAAGVRHITYLSAFGIDQAPPQVALRAVELDLMARARPPRSRPRARLRDPSRRSRQTWRIQLTGGLSPQDRSPSARLRLSLAALILARCSGVSTLPRCARPMFARCSGVSARPVR
jgi:NAD(P)-dependent dehydrogenase (short-subunit alcohol dehydrogenase family)